MSPVDADTSLPIGEVLKRTRTRHKIDIRAVEQATKIRIKYLRALENEEWDVLPGPAYARGFLRTYAQFLGLDADALVDEYRRTVETALRSEQPYSLGEPVLERRVRAGAEPRRAWSGRASVLTALGAAALIVLLILGLTGGSGQKGHHPKGKDAAQRQEPGGKSKSRPNAPPSPPVTVALVTRDDMEVCLVTGDGRALIDSQTLVSGAEEGPFQPPAERYRLDLDSGGAVDLTVNGKRRRVRSRGPASFEISSAGVVPTDFKGPDCP